MAGRGRVRALGDGRRHSPGHPASLPRRPPLSPQVRQQAKFSLAVMLVASRAANGRVRSQWSLAFRGIA